MKLVRSLVVWALLLAALAPAGAAAAETRSFVKLGAEAPTGDANATFGPATDYPSAIVVAGVPGTVTKVTATVFGLSSGAPDDIDMALVGPNGGQVMLMSDACGPNSMTAKTWTFDDAAPTSLSDNGPCSPLTTVGSFKPSDFEDPALDNLAKEGGGPPPPYTNSLSDLAGGSPEGNWELFVLDDNKMVVGFGFDAWALTLEVEPPPPPPPIVQTVTVTVPGPATGASPAPPKPVSKETGKRAAALAKCAKKKNKEKRAKCRVKARKLPL